MANPWVKYCRGALGWVKYCRGALGWVKYCRGHWAGLSTAGGIGLGCGNQPPWVKYCRGALGWDVTQ